MKKFDLTTVYNKDRPLSWSGMSAFEWRPSDWYLKYVVHGKCTRDDIDKGTEAFCVVTMMIDPNCPVVKKTPELEFGSFVDKKIQYDSTFLPQLVRLPVLQHEMTGTFDGIPLLGYSDAFEELWQKYQLRDYKTGRKPWDQKRADETGQLTMYAFMLYLKHKLKPEWGDFYIDWMPTHYKDGKIEFIKEGEIITFKTKRTMTQVLEFGTRIRKTWEAMEEYATNQMDMDESDFFAHVDK